jgi:predicted acetyltransferase
MQRGKRIMQAQGLRLIEPSLELKDQFFDFARESLAAGKDSWREGFEKALADFPAYVRKFADYREGRNLPEGWVQDSTQWLIDGDGTILGWVSIRHRLTERLMHRGGHIGYYIRPSARRRGHGTLICRLALEKAREIGIRRVLITCAKDNIGSNRIIRKNGGVLENEVWDEADKETVCRYWIDL